MKSLTEMKQFQEKFGLEKKNRSFKKNNEKFKLELVKAIPEDETVTFYRQGKFLDLCRGPTHVQQKNLAILSSLPN